MMIYRKLMAAGGLGPGLWAFTPSNTVVDGAPWPNVASMSFGLGSSFQTIRGDAIAVGNWSLSNNCIWFADSGTKMYVQESDNKDLYQFTLSTAYDLSTATYASKTVSYLANTATCSSGIFMSSDGTKMWMSDQTTEEVDYYTLSTAYDISTATYDSTSTVVAARDTNIGSCAVSADGSTLVVIGQTDVRFMEFAFGTAYDMSSLSFTQEDVAASTDDYFIINSDGTKEWSWSTGGDNLYSENWSTAWDVISRASAGSIDLSTNCGLPTSIADDIYGLQWNADGSSFWVVINVDQRSTGDFTAYKIDCTTNYDISTAGTWTEPSQWIDLGLSSNQIEASTFGDDGKKFFVLRDAGSLWRVDSFPLSTPYDITTAGSVTTSTLSNAMSSARGFLFNHAGTKMWIGDPSTIAEYNLSTAWDITTLSYSGYSASFTRDPVPYAINQDETAIYCNDFNLGHMRIDLTTPGTLAGGTTQVNRDYFAEGEYSPQMSPTGDQFLGWEYDNGSRTECNMSLFSLSTPYDVNTRTLVETFAFPYIFDWNDLSHNLNRISERGHMGVIYIESIDRWVKIELS